MHEKEESAEIKKFEAALAALAPRIDRFDRDRLMFLAGQQSVLKNCIGKGAECEAILPSPIGRGAGGEGWVWPAAFTAMTAVAAALFVMLMLKSAPEAATDLSGTAKHTTLDTPLVLSVPATADYSNSARMRALQIGENRSILGLAFLSGADDYIVGDADSKCSYPRLLNQILAYGVDSWQPSSAGISGNKTTVTRPQTRQEFMKQFLNQNGSGRG
jgi:hypothetical protein